VWSANPYLSAGEVHQIMQETAVDLGFPGYDYEYGAGFVNADAAVRRAMALRSSFQLGSAASDAMATTVLPETAAPMELGFAPLTQATESVPFTASNLVSDDSLAVGSTVQADEPAAVLEAGAIALDSIGLPTVQNGTLGSGTLARGVSEGAIAPDAVSLPSMATANLMAESGVEALRLERSWALTAEADRLAANLVQPLGQVLAAEVDALTGKLVAAV